jgi:glyoxylase-like metal-dependent hydrolase (beta-lactamase superfamily II)
MKRMIHQVVEGIYRVEIPLPIPVVRSMNCYVITDSDRSLVVDPGMAHEMCRRALLTSLNEIGIDLTRTDFLITHHHLDHFGLLPGIIGNGSRVYLSAIEATIIEKIASGAILPILSRLLHLMGFPEEDPQKALPELLGDEYGAMNQWPFHHLSDGTIITKGGRDFRCILAPGHSPGHICLHEADSGLLIAGDVFSPVLQFFCNTENPLQHQLESFRHLNALNARAVLPGHRDIFTRVAETTEQLETHHRLRNESIVEALADRSMDAYQVADRLAPGTQASGPWDALPNILKFIAARDCLAHLLYLESEGRVTRKTVAERMIYSLAKNHGQPI